MGLNSSNNTGHGETANQLLVTKKIYDDFQFFLHHEIASFLRSFILFPIFSCSQIETTSITASIDESLGIVPEIDSIVCLVQNWTCKMPIRNSSRRFRISTQLR